MAADVDSQVHNPLDVDLKITFAQSDAKVDGETYAQFGHTFDNFVIPAKSSANSGKIPNVLLVKGTLASLPIIPLGRLDTYLAATAE